MTTRRDVVVTRLLALALSSVVVALVSGCGSSDTAHRSSSELEDSSGSRYRITITADNPTRRSSPGGCYPEPPGGRTSQQFAVTVTNLVAHAVPAPEMFFGANLNDDATRVLDVETVENAYGLVEAFSAEVPTNCALSMDFAPHGATIAANDKVTVLVTVSVIADPPPVGMALLTRVFLADGTAHDLVTPA